MLTYFFSVPSWGKKIIFVLSVFPQRICFLNLRSFLRVLLEAWFPTLVVLQSLAQNYCLPHHSPYCTCDIDYDFLRFGLLLIIIKLNHWSPICQDHSEFWFHLSKWEKLGHICTFNKQIYFHHPFNYWQYINCIQPVAWSITQKKHPVWHKTLHHCCS